MCLSSLLSLVLGSASREIDRIPAYWSFVPVFSCESIEMTICVASPAIFPLTVHSIAVYMAFVLPECRVFMLFRHTESDSDSGCVSVYVCVRDKNRRKALLHLTIINKAVNIGAKGFLKYLLRLLSTPTLTCVRHRLFLSTSVSICVYGSLCVYVCDHQTESRRGASDCDTRYKYPHPHLHEIRSSIHGSSHAYS